MSGKSGSPLRILATRFRLISSLTDSIRCPLALSSPSVRGRSVTIVAISGSSFARSARRPFVSSRRTYGFYARQHPRRSQRDRRAAEPGRRERLRPVIRSSRVEPGGPFRSRSGQGALGALELEQPADALAAVD